MMLTERHSYLSPFILSPRPISSPHLIEVELSHAEGFDWGKVTQENPMQPRSNWQVAYDEQPLDEDERRWAFFFHYLDPSRPLLTPDGPVNLPPPTPRPAHLNSIEYLEP
jgi:hypothetical protein